MRLLAAHGVRPDTDLGQHFLLDENLVDLAVRRAGVGPDDVVLEVGAGLGVLTVALARAAATVHAVELDRRLEPALAEAITGLANVRLHWGDAMRLDLEALAPAPTALVANLPYAIATPLVLESLWRLPTVERWCVMAQREVVDRWLAPPGGPLYGVPLGAAAAHRGAHVPPPGRTRGLRAASAGRLGSRGPPAHRPRAGAGGARDRAGGLLDAPQDPRQRPRRGGGGPRRGRQGARRGRAAGGRPPPGRAPRRLRGPRRGAGVDRLTLAAPAKLNLRLLVGPRGRDGFHPLRTLMVALDGLADRVHAERAPERSVSCPGIEGPANLAWRALDALEAHSGRALPLRLVIDKEIPAQAGLGGGSSDAAAALLAANRLHGLGLGPDALERVAARVGSDVPFFIRAGAQWAEGRGERLRPATPPRFAALLSMPPSGLSTAAVYERFDREPEPPPADEADPPLAMPELAAWLRNDLWPAARVLAPELVAREDALRSAGAPAVLLCGSGACMAGVFPDRDAAEAAERRLDAPGFRAVVTPAGSG